MKSIGRTILLFITCTLLTTNGYSQYPAYTVELIAETKDNSLLTQVVDLDFRTDQNGDSLLYVADVFTSAVLVFEKQKEELNVINRLGREGRGPGEFIELTNLELFTDENALMIYDGNLVRITLLNLTTEEAEQTIGLDFRRDSHFPSELYLYTINDGLIESYK